MLGWIIGVALAAAGCASKDTTAPPGPCSSGICGSGGDGNSGSGAGPTTTTGGGCAESWSCTPWNKGADGTYARTCTDAAACGTTTQKPSEGPVALPDLDLDYYKCNVEPILDGSCAMLGCHGVEQGRALEIYARGRLRHKETVVQVSSCPIGPQMLDLAAEATGTVMCVGWSPHTAAEWQENYDSARSFMVGGQPTYTPGQKYQVDVKLVGEHLGLSGCGQYLTHVNNFAATVEGASGKLAGVLGSDSGQSSSSCPKDLPKPISGTTVLYGDCHALISSGAENMSSWSFSWTAPAAGSGGLTLFYGAVDGDRDMMSMNDDVKVGTIKLGEATAALEAPPRDWRSAMLAFSLVPIGLAARLRKRKATKR